jgi:hypothetical protein
MILMAHEIRISFFKITPFIITRHINLFSRKGAVCADKPVIARGKCGAGLGTQVQTLQVSIV